MTGELYIFYRYKWYFNVDAAYKILISKKVTIHLDLLSIYKKDLNLDFATKEILNFLMIFIDIIIDNLVSILIKKA